MRWCGNKSEIWYALCEVSKDSIPWCGPESAECRSKDSRRCRKNRYHSSGSIRNGKSHVCKMHAKSTRYCTDTRSIGNVVSFPERYSKLIILKRRKEKGGCCNIFGLVARGEFTIAQFPQFFLDIKFVIKVFRLRYLKDFYESTKRKIRKEFNNNL